MNVGSYSLRLHPIMFYTSYEQGIYEEFAKMPNEDLIRIWINFLVTYFAPKTKVSVKRYDDLIKLEFSFHVSF
jgi:hypothetical protein